MRQYQFSTKRDSTFRVRSVKNRQEWYSPFFTDRSKATYQFFQIEQNNSPCHINHNIWPLSNPEDFYLTDDVTPNNQQPILENIQPKNEITRPPGSNKSHGSNKNDETQSSVEKKIGTKGILPINEDELRKMINYLIHQGNIENRIVTEIRMMMKVENIFLKQLYGGAFCPRFGKLLKKPKINTNPAHQIQTRQ